MFARVVICAALAFVAFGDNSASLYNNDVSEKLRFDMKFFAGSQLIKVNKTTKTATEVFAENDIVLLYIPAHWCPPCKTFTPKLTSFYNALKKQGKKIEVIFLSCDGSEGEMMTYMKEMHGDWFASEYGTPAESEISDHFNVTSIPVLIVLSGSGKVITTDGRNDVTNLGAKAWKKWAAAAK